MIPDTKSNIHHCFTYSLTKIHSLLRLESFTFAIVESYFNSLELLSNNM